MGTDNEAMIGKESAIKTVAKVKGKTKEAEMTGKMGDPPRTNAAREAREKPIS